MSSERFPRTFRIRQRFEAQPELDVPGEAGRLLRPALEKAALPAKARVAIAVGSRGINHLASIVRAVVQEIQGAGGLPFIVPAMGSHGGATPSGQEKLLAGYGISESALGVPIAASMETDLVDTTPNGFPVHLSREVRRADAVVLVNRIKPHTDFSGRYGSGLIKMLVVGLGKHAGAAAFHAAASRHGYERVLLEMATACQRHLPLLGGLATLENARHECAQLHFLPAADLLDQEPPLVAAAARLMPRLPVDDIDVLVVDEIGKNISGTGMDPAVIRRHVNGYLSSLAQDDPRPRIRRIVVLGLSPASGGNAIGIGMADFTTTRLVRAMDAHVTATNALTALSIQAAKIPLHFDSDREALAAAIRSLALADPAQARVVRIANTLDLETLEISEACAGVLAGNPALERISDPLPPAFDRDGNLPPL
jgi:hypothetical protein